MHTLIHWNIGQMVARLPLKVQHTNNCVEKVSQLILALQKWMLKYKPEFIILKRKEKGGVFA